MSVQPTSIEAYNDTEALRETIENEIYNFLGTVENATNKEMSRALGREINTITPGTYSLREKGCVLKDGRRTCAISGRSVYAWKLNPDSPTPQDLMKNTDRAYNNGLVDGIKLVFRSFKAIGLDIKEKFPHVYHAVVLGYRELRRNKP